jgi:hypothetical protein
MPIHCCFPAWTVRYCPECYIYTLPSKDVLCFIGHAFPHLGFLGVQQCYLRGIPSSDEVVAALPGEPAGETRKR